MAAENDIDRLIRRAFFAKIRSGVLVEVGAARPDYLSISASYRELGWKVIAIEPNPDFCAAHRAMGYDVLEYAVSDKEQDDADFFVVDSHSANYLDGTVSFESFSSLGIRGSYADLYEKLKAGTDVKTIRVKVRTLDTILALHEPKLRAIDILVVDVEGWELNVMRGLSIERYRPKVIILENLGGDAGYVDFMHVYGYGRWRRFGLNEVYVRPDLRGSIRSFFVGRKQQARQAAGGLRRWVSAHMTSSGNINGGC